MKLNRLCIYINAYFANNLGDDIFVHLLCRHYPNVLFYAYIPNKFNGVFQGIDNLETLETNIEIYDIQENIDFQVLIGGSLFDEPNSDVDRKKKLEKLYMLRISTNIPFFIIGANWGKHTKTYYFNTCKEWFSTLEGISFRDLQSYRLFKTLNNSMWAPDLIFTYRMPQAALHTSKMIAICPIFKTPRSGLNDFSNIEYCSFLANISKRYIEYGYNIILAAFCKAQADHIACQKIYNNIPQGLKYKAKVIIYDNDIDFFLNQLICAEYIIGTRFHSIIIGLKNNIPVFPIIYNVKTKNIIDCYGYRGKYTDITCLKDLSFDFVDSNRKEHYIFDASECEKTASLHYHFLNEAIIKRMGEL